MAEAGDEEVKPITLRDYFELRLRSLSERLDSKIDNLSNHLDAVDTQKDIARKLALIELERRLADLNHAHQRAADVLITYLPREVWEKYREEDGIWKRQEEVVRASLVTQSEFLAYKETTQQALTLAVGKSQGIGSVWGGIVVAFSGLAAIGTIVTGVLSFTHH